MNAVIEVGFDYSLLDTSDGVFARDAAVRIKVRIAHTAEDIVEIGRDLIAVKKMLPHGSFIRWIEAEFGMNERSAQRFMMIAERFGSNTTRVSSFSFRTIAALAAPSTPDEVVEEAVEKAATGETVSAADVARMKAEWAAERHQLKNQIVNARTSAKDAKATVTDHSNTLAALRAENERLRDEKHTLEFELRRASRPVERHPVSSRVEECAQWLMSRLSVDDAEHLATWLSEVDPKALAKAIQRAVAS